jgi:hypothetical protein
LSGKARNRTSIIRKTVEKVGEKGNLFEKYPADQRKEKNWIYKIKNIIKK